MKHFALVKTAGVLAADLLELPLSEKDIHNAVNTVADAWIQEAGSLSDVERGIIALRDFILQHRESRFRKLPDDDRFQIIDLCGYWDMDARIYYFTEGGIKKACLEYDWKAVVEALAERQHLHTNEKDHRNIKFPSRIMKHKGVDKLETLRGYAVRSSIHDPN
jgi:hypothetical protein